MERNEKSVIYLDTHIVCWLYEGKIEKLTQPAVDAIDSGKLFVSPMVDLEIQYLYEIGRITDGSEIVLSTLVEDIGLQMSKTSFSLIIKEARAINWTRDPFDRIITAETLITEDALLITKDKIIREHCDKAVW